MANNYCIIGDITAQLPESDLQSSTDYTAALDFMIAAASRLIDREVGRWDGYFYPTGTAEVRLYDGNGRDELWLDEFLSLTQLKVAENSLDFITWQSADYILAPYNAPLIGQPYQKIIIHPDGARLFFPAKRRNVRVTGVFGFSATTPPQVKQACIIQVVRWHMRAKQMYQDVGGTAAFAAFTVSGRLDDDIVRLLSGYKANTIAEHD